MARWTRSPAEREDGAAIADFVLVSLVLIPLFLGVVQVGLVLYLRNSAAAAASEGARYGARLDHGPADAVRRAQQQLDGVVGDRFVRGVSARHTELDGVAVVEVRVQLTVPPLGLWGPAVEMELSGHGVREVEP